MRILYDGLVYSIQTVGGINRYFAQIIGRLPEDVTPILLWLSPTGSWPSRNTRGWR